MASIEIGRVCVKTAGRNAGKYCIVTGIIDNSFVEITGPNKLNKVKRKRCNVSHLEPTSHKIKIKQKASDDIVESALKKVKLSETIKEGIKFRESL